MLQRFYGDVVCRYQNKMYFTVLVKGVDGSNYDDCVKQNFVYAQHLNILADQENLASKIFNMRISNKNEEEVFDADFPTACFYFDSHDKLIEEHANCFTAKNICQHKFGAVIKKYY